MLFSEIYSTYYNTVAAILRKAVKGPVTQSEISRIVEEKAFGESILTIPQAIKEERWPLIIRDGSASVDNKPSMPLTTLQKQWINAIAEDPRIKLFGENIVTYPNVEPLFTSEDYSVFDNYLDGDNYSDENYVKIFRTILGAINNQLPIAVDIYTRKGVKARNYLMPKYIEYSEKDDKFRLIGAGGRFGNTINIGRILNCEICPTIKQLQNGKMNPAKPRQVILEVTDRRNALERVLLHFAYYKKESRALLQGARHQGPGNRP